MSAKIRSDACVDLQAVFDKKMSAEDVGSLVYEIEKAVYLDSIRTMVQSQGALWKPVYKSIISNLLFNLRDYIHAEKVIERIIKNPKQEMARILVNGPLALNEDLKEIKDLSLQEGGTRVRFSSNTGGMVRCPSCRKTEVYRQLVQDRGGDEAF